MTRMAHKDRRVTGGVDTHADAHAAAVIDEVGRVLGTESFPADEVGYAALLRWLRRSGELARVGVEGTGSYGAGLARHLSAHGVEVIEVIRPNRQTRRRRGKSDPTDAEAVARAVLSGEAQGAPKSRDGAAEALRALRVARQGAVKARVQAGEPAPGPRRLGSRGAASTAALAHDRPAHRARSAVPRGHERRPRRGDEDRDALGCTTLRGARHRDRV